MSNLRQEVFRALAAAEENGYTFPNWTAETIAVDICELDADFESTDPQTIIVFVEEWLDGARA